MSLRVKQRVPAPHRAIWSALRPVRLALHQALRDRRVFEIGSFHHSRIDQFGLNLKQTEKIGLWI
jgi:hypothetical protein